MPKAFILNLMYGYNVVYDIIFLIFSWLIVYNLLVLFKVKKFSNRVNLILLILSILSTVVMSTGYFSLTGENYPILFIMSINLALFSIFIRLQSNKS